MPVAPSEILASLNPAQREAVTHAHGPLLILAGAGSGKTRVVTSRIAWLLAHGAPPESILAITFTNKAAREMRDRAERLSGLQSPWISTFHSFGARLLRRHIYRLEPYDTSFTICDPDDCRAIIRGVLKDRGIDTQAWQPRTVLREVSRLKTACGGDPDALGADYLHGQLLREIFIEYTRRMRDRNLLDFDDLLLLLVRLFEEHPDVAERYRSQFEHILVDEYQDTNSVQYRICRLLAPGHHDLSITGDPDQSIYRWRGADLRNILDFEKDYPGARVVRLEQNYRSTDNVLWVANALIEHNLDRKPKSLWTENEQGEPVRVMHSDDERDEARKVVSTIERLRDEGMPLGEIAVFYRINSLSRALEQQLIYSNVPYAIVGGLEFFLRKEVKDLLAWLRILSNPRDSESLRRIINVPPRSIGSGTLNALEAAAEARGRGLLEVVLDRELREELSSRQAAAVDDFRDLYRELERIEDGPVEGVLRTALDKTGYREWLEQSGEESRERLENVGELLGAAVEYDRAEPEGGIGGFLELSALLGDVDRWEPREDRVTLMSIHAAKGLEFSAVLVVGCEDRLLPLVRASDPEPDIEEERRLLYVAITRARKRLWLSHASVRMRYGRPQRSSPSRFLRELQPPREDAQSSFERLSMDLQTERHLHGRRSPFDELAAPSERNTARPGGRGPSPEEDPIAAEFLASQDGGDGTLSQDDDGFEADEDPFAPGTRVAHAEYGEGEVLRTSGFGRRRQVTVRFEEPVGEKHFSLVHTSLSRLR